MALSPKLVDAMIYALRCTPEQTAELRSLSGDALAKRMGEVMRANGLNLLDLTKRKRAYDAGRALPYDMEVRH